MKKILSILVLVLMLVGCSTNDAKGLIDWNNNLVDSSNTMLKLAENKSDKKEFEAELNKYTELIKAGDDIELDKETKELHDKLKEHHTKSIDLIQIIYKNNDEENAKKVEKHNKATNEYNKGIKEMDEIMEKVFEKQ